MVSDYEDLNNSDSVEDTEIMDNPPIDAFNRALARDPNKLPTVTYVLDPEQAHQYGIDQDTLESTSTQHDPTFIDQSTVEDPTFIEQVSEQSSPPTLERMYLEQPKFEEPPIQSGSTGGFAPIPDPAAMPIELGNIHFGRERGVWKGKSPAMRRLVVVVSGLVIGVLLTIAMSQQSPQTLPPLPVGDDVAPPADSNIAAVVGESETKEVALALPETNQLITSDDSPTQLAVEKENTFSSDLNTGEVTDVGLNDPIVVEVVAQSEKSSVEALAGLSNEELVAEIAQSEQLAKIQGDSETVTKSQLEIIQDYVSGKKPVISAREFMYISDKLRSYNPDFVAPNQPQTQAAGRGGNVPVLRAVPGKNGRFNSGDGSVDWQGNFSLNNPGQNIEVGKAYQQYLKDIVGSSNTSSGIISRQTGGTNLLKSSVGTGRAPTPQ